MLIIASFAAAIIAGLLYDMGDSAGLCLAFSVIGVVCLVGGFVKHMERDFE